jgi:IS605 OrfB family transposase
MKIIRTDNWKLKATQEQIVMFKATSEKYRAYVKALIGVVWVHYAEINKAKSPCSAVEKFIHQTTKNPKQKYKYFDKNFHKFPSYLRRAAIEAALGQVSSFSTRYDQWQTFQRGNSKASPPKRTHENTLNPPLYGGQCIKYNDDMSVASIKVWSGTDWVWTEVKITSKRKRHTIPKNKALSPTLLSDGKYIKISVPFQSYIGTVSYSEVKRVLAVDLGINNTATGSIITAAGTVIARQFFHKAMDIDRRDKGLLEISKKARQTMGKTGKLGKGFCSTPYRKAANRNKQMVNVISRELLDFAALHEAEAIVFEYLKHFRPKAGKKRSNLKQKFHGWLHRKLVKKVQERADEAGVIIYFVNPAGTSKYAFDGSGEVKRDPKNRTLATFKNGKQYNCDLSASYNIGARFFIEIVLFT